MSHDAQDTAAETYCNAAYAACARSDHAVAGALFNEALSELDVLDPRWPRVWLSSMAAQIRANDPVAQVEAAANGATRMLAAAPLDLPLDGVTAWFEAAFFPLTIPGVRDLVTIALAPLAIRFAAEGRRHLNQLAARALDQIAAALLERGDARKAAVLDARLCRISPARAQSINLNLQTVRARWAIETAHAEMH